MFWIKFFKIKCNKKYFILINQLNSFVNLNFNRKTFLYKLLFIWYYLFLVYNFESENLLKISRLFSLLNMYWFSAIYSFIFGKMSSYIQTVYNPDKMMYCPYDSSHMIKASLYKMHIMMHQGYVSSNFC